MQAAPDLESKSSKFLIYPQETVEIDFDGWLKPMDDDEFFEFCQRQRGLRIEMDRYGEIIIMPPTGGETGRINFRLIARFAVWVDADGTGEGFDSSTGFILPNRAKRSPDLAWIKREKWLAIPLEQRKKFAPICPDFVVELRSETDSLPRLQAKMAEYIENGAALGWLIDVAGKTVYIYRPATPVEVLAHPAEVSGEPLLKGFVLRMDAIFV